MIGHVRRFGSKTMTPGTHSSAITIRPRQASAGGVVRNAQAPRVAIFRRSGDIGNSRRRLPVSRATALAMAGATTGTPASPMPVGALSVEITFTSIGGTSDMRITL